MIENILIKVTNKCNMHCSMCGQNKRNERYSCENVDFDTLQSFLPKNLSGVNVCIWGGEPLLYSSIIELLTVLRSRGAYIGIITNGYFLDRYVKDIIDLKIDYITISIDGTENTHNKIRKINNAYQVAIKNIKNIVEEKKKNNLVGKCMFININYTILNENIDEMVKIGHLAEEIGCSSITYNFPILVNEKACEQFETIWKKNFGSDFKSWEGYKVENTNIDIAKLYGNIIQIKKELGKLQHFKVMWSTNNQNLNIEFLNDYFNNIDNEQMKGILCKIAKNTIVINSDGNLLLCPDYTETIMGNISTETYEEYLKKIKKNIILEKFGVLPVCERCCHRYD